MRRDNVPRVNALRDLLGRPPTPVIRLPSLLPHDTETRRAALLH
jgi:hypothetical protein